MERQAQWASRQRVGQCVVAAKSGEPGGKKSELVCGGAAIQRLTTAQQEFIALADVEPHLGHVVVSEVHERPVDAALVGGAGLGELVAVRS